MGKMISDKCAAREQENISDSRQYMSDLRNIRGTLAAEGMTISESTRHNLERIAGGQVSYRDVLAELRAKYEKRE